MKNIFITLLYCIIFSPAANSQDNRLSIVDIDRQKDNKGSLKMSDVFSDVEYLKLEFNDDYPVGNVNEIIATSRHIFLEAKSTGGGRFFKYSRTGKFIALIARIGQGPGEYLAGSALIVDEKKSRIYIRTNFSNSIHIYDYETGKYLHSFPVKNEDRMFVLFDSGKLWCEGSYFFRYKPEYCAWKVMDSEGNVLKTQKSPFFSIPDQQKVPSTGLSPNTLYWETSESRRYYEIKTDTVYALDANFKSTPRYAFKWQPIHKKGDIFIGGETSDYLILRMYDHDTKVPYDGYYDKKKEVYYSYQLDNNLLGDFMPGNMPGIKSLGLVNDLDGGLPFQLYGRGTFNSLGSQVWYTTIDAYKLIEYVKSPAFRKSSATQPEKKEALKKFVQTLNENDNPVLVIAKLK